MDSVYDVIELVGTSSKSWEDAARIAVETASRTIKDIRVAEVVTKDIAIVDGNAMKYRVRLNLSFRYHPIELPWVR